MVCGDHNGLNNQRSNLRPCSQGQNNGNSRQRVGRSGFRGVYLKKETLRWAACISPHRHLGTYSTQEEAARAYDEAAIERFGEFGDAELSARARAMVAAQARPGRSRGGVMSERLEKDALAGVVYPITSTLGWIKQ